MEIKPQLSLFDNDTCTQCGSEVEKDHVYCDKCAKKWVDKYLNADQLDGKD
jgi:predicted amidophosphoribosyltransferase